MVQGNQCTRVVRFSAVDRVERCTWDAALAEADREVRHSLWARRDSAVDRVVERLRGFAGEGIAFASVALVLSCIIVLR